MFTHGKKHQCQHLRTHIEKKNLKFQSEVEIKITVKKFMIYILMNESFFGFYCSCWINDDLLRSRHFRNIIFTLRNENVFICIKREIKYWMNEKNLKLKVFALNVNPFGKRREKSPLSHCGIIRWDFRVTRRTSEAFATIGMYVSEIEWK